MHDTFLISDFCHGWGEPNIVSFDSWENCPFALWHAGNIQYLTQLEWWALISEFGIGSSSLLGFEGWGKWYRDNFVWIYMWRKSLPRWSNILKRLSQTVDVWVSFTFSSVDQILRSNHQTTALNGKNLHFSRRKLPSWPPNTGDWAIPKVFFLHKKYDNYICWGNGYLSIEMIFVLSQGSGCHCGRPQIEGDEQKIIISSITLDFLIFNSQKPLRGKRHRLFLWQHEGGESLFWQHNALQSLRRLAL